MLSWRIANFRRLKRESFSRNDGDDSNDVGAVVVFVVFVVGWFGWEKYNDDVALGESEEFKVGACRGLGNIEEVEINEDGPWMAVLMIGEVVVCWSGFESKESEEVKL